MWAGGMVFSGDDDVADFFCPMVSPFVVVVWLKKEQYCIGGKL